MDGMYLQVSLFRILEYLLEDIPIMFAIHTIAADRRIAHGQDPCKK